MYKLGNVHVCLNVLLLVGADHFGLLVAGQDDGNVAAGGWRRAGQRGRRQVDRRGRYAAVYAAVRRCCRACWAAAVAHLTEERIGRRFGERSSRR